MEGRRAKITLPCCQHTCETYLQLRKGDEAAAEFKKIIDHPGLTVNLLVLSPVLA
jgi:hypothetical protein